MGPSVSLGGLLSDANSPFWVTTDFEYSSAYVFRGLQRAEGSFVPSLEVGYTDYYIGIWSNQPLHGHQGSEFDIYGGFRREVVKNLTVGLSGTYFRYPGANGITTKENYEGGVDFTYAYEHFTATVYYFHDFKMKSDSLQGSLQYSFPIDSIQGSLDTSFTIGTVHATDWFPNAGFNFLQSYRYHGFNISLPVRLSKRATVKVGANYAHNDNFVPGVVDKDVVWWTAGIRLGF